eukprot:CAMPEP_0168326572 /NCGR_PEP_ID=MMETSP0213-20121227/5378_1 /TAXON_ID=151035 /ORGANISM="Euplotes harpa, Strain FSP1.4" /LENGTH=67 /DNA_ID=CAMNT_0008329303 /DNA_START=11 /DNA_END=214 /DNA_ORIENTATION=+
MEGKPKKTKPGKEGEGGDVPVGFFHENEGLSLVGLITPKEYKRFKISKELMEGYQEDFNEQEYLERK